MTRERIQRMKRLVDLGEHAVKVRRQALAASERAKESALAEERRLQREWEERAQKSAQIRAISVEAFADSRLALDALNAEAKRAGAITMTATSAVEKNREALTEANLELKKLELWRDGAQGTLREMESRQERKQTDETAARSRGKKS